ncbi:F-box/FBD/LRR-repeat protein-like protein isoform X1 [Tanacetum coccineum]
MFLAEASVDEKVPTIFPCLKTLTLSIVNFSSDGMLSFVMEMMCGSPNLQNLNITATYMGNISRHALPSLDLDYNTIGQLHLQCVVFSSFRGAENEVCLIKYILACSPLLKNIAITLSSLPGGDSGKFKFAQKLLTLHRASPIAEIGLY